MRSLRPLSLPDLARASSSVSTYSALSNFVVPVGSYVTMYLPVFFFSAGAAGSAGLLLPAGFAAAAGFLSLAGLSLTFGKLRPDAVLVLSLAAGLAVRSEAFLAVGFFVSSLVAVGSVFFLDATGFSDVWGKADCSTLPFF